jgi:predicted nucleotidyltransferase
MAKIDDLIVKKVKMFLLKLKESGVSVNSACLFGSYAKRSSKFSDIDVGIISSDFSDDRFE